jgi:hypothetical protein
MANLLFQYYHSKFLEVAKGLLDVTKWLLHNPSSE